MQNFYLLKGTACLNKVVEIIIDLNRVQTAQLYKDEDGFNIILKYASGNDAPLAIFNEESEARAELYKILSIIDPDKKDLANQLTMFVVKNDKGDMMSKFRDFLEKA